MNRKDYQQVKQIFQSILDIAPDNRADYLNEKCSGKTAIRQEVEKLLNSYESGYLEQPAIEKVAELMVAKQWEAGQTIGHYKIVKKIGKGGMGEVYLAQDTMLDRKVAIKFLNEEFSKDADKLNRFVQEAKAVSALNHPNILTVYEIGEKDASKYLVTEFIEGKTLRQNLSPKETNSLSAILKIGVQVAEALSAAHQAGIIHRDIKPENIMIRQDGYAKVLDFGLAKLTLKKNEVVDADGETLAQVNTTPGLVMGTPAYMSPEQARGKQTDARSDIWSLGVVLYEMLAGREPFAGETTSDKIASILKSPPPPLDEHTPPELNRIIRKALQKNRDERYQTVKDLLLDLKEIRMELEFQDKLDQSYDPSNEKAKTKTYKKTGTTAKTMDETAPQHTFQAFTDQYSSYFQLSSFSRSFVKSSCSFVDNFFISNNVYFMLEECAKFCDEIEFSRI